MRRFTLSALLAFSAVLTGPFALAAEETAPASTPESRALTPPPIAIPEAKVDLPKLPSAADFARPMPTPTFAAPAMQARQDGGEFAYARVIGDAVDFEIVRELPPGAAGLAEVRIPLFARIDVESDQVLRQAALSLEWGDQTIRDFERVDVPGKNAAPDGVVVYWFTPNSDARVRYAGVRNPDRRMRLSFRQPLINGRVVFATAMPRIDFPSEGRPWHRQLFIRSLRTNLLGRVSAGVESERLGDALVVFHRDEAYVEIVAAPPTRAP